jgi:hypothetical protein
MMGKVKRQPSVRAWLLVALAASIPLPLSAQELSLEEIVNRCAQPMGGSGNLESLETLRFEHRSLGSDVSTKWEIVRPNVVRKEREGEWVLLFDGYRAGYLEGPVREDGTKEGAHLLSEDHWKDFEMDMALYVPAFFDHPAEYEDAEVIDEKDAHLLRVTLPLGMVVEYAIDAESFLPIR